MKKASLRAALAVGALSVISSQALASAVTVVDSLTVAWNMTPESIGTSTMVAGTNPAYYELVVGASGVDTRFTQIDSSPEAFTVNYELFFDNDNNLNSSDVGSSAFWTWAATDILGTATQSASTYLAANTQYVLKMWTVGAPPTIGSTSEVSAVPLPGAALLFGSALLGAGALRRKQNKAA